MSMHSKYYADYTTGIPFRLLSTGYYNKAAGAGQLLDYSTAAKRQLRGRDTDAEGTHWHNG